ncbi:MAG: hypothetical protein AB1586_08495 [Pseudomonadota bacterium]
MRSRAGWCLALLYLACVLLPGLSLTFAADAAQAAPCLEHAMVVSAHHEAAGAHHAAVHDGAHHHAGMTASAADVAASAADASDHTSSHPISPGPCCAMMCLSALPAAPAEMAAPAAVTTRCVPDTARSLTDAAPRRHDRPPMA